MFETLTKNVYKYFIILLWFDLFLECLIYLFYFYFIFFNMFKIN